MKTVFSRTSSLLSVSDFFNELQCLIDTKGLWDKISFVFFMSWLTSSACFADLTPPAGQN